MNLITAPDGAIFALLCIATASPLVPDEDSELWLREQSLIEDTAGGVTEITGRGRAWLAMIGKTPLPVRVERWDDPRGEAIAQPAPAPVDAAALGAAIAAALKPAAVAAQTAAAVASAPPPVAPRPPPPGARPVPRVSAVPLDFIPVPDQWTRTPAGQTPAGIKPDQDVQVIFSDLRVSAFRAAQSIIWEHRGVPDDVIAYKLGDNDTMNAPRVIA